MNAYAGLIPPRYRKASGIDVYEARVLHPWHRPFQWYLDKKGVVRSLPFSAVCHLKVGGRTEPVLIERDAAPRLYEGIIQLGKALFTGVRVQKYLTAYKAYESVTDDPAPELAAIRHGLSHPASLLTRPATRRALEELFGTVTIDLSRSAHVRLLYKYLGLLLIEADRHLADALENSRTSWSYVPGGAKLLHDWQVVEKR